MNFKFTFLLLSVVLTFQCFNAASIPKTAKQKLTQFIIDEINKFTHLKLDECRRIAEAVLTDPKVLEHKTAAMENYLKNFRQFVADVKEFGDAPFISFTPSEAPKKLMTEQSILFSEFAAPETLEADIIRQSLIRHGVTKQWNLIEPTMQTYAESFIQQAEEYLKNHPEDTQLKNTLDELNRMSNAEKRMDRIQDYFAALPTEDILLARL